MKKKILSLLTAFAMVFGIIAAPFTNASANNENNPNSTTIVVHKVLMNEDDWKAFGKDAK